MFEDFSGRLVKNVEDAEGYLWKFMAENLCCPDRHIREHSGDFDLYLPWLLEILEYQRSGDRSEALPILEIQRLYMDAAWDMVTKGFLRPGPRTITGDPMKDGYGKGYSLTNLGRTRLDQILDKQCDRIQSA